MPTVLESSHAQVAPPHPAGDRPGSLWCAAACAVSGTVEGDEGELCADPQASREVAVVGATVYSCLKAGTKSPLPGFGLVVVDEASQVRVAESAVAVAQVGSEGWLAGDDLQLPLVVQGVYPEPEAALVRLMHPQHS
jgi:hypothetical protein